MRTFAFVVVHVCRLDEDRRFSAPLAAFAALEITSGGGDLAEELWAVITGSCVQILPSNSVLISMRRRFADLSRAVQWQSGGDKRTDILRRLDSLLPISCRRHGKKARCILSNDFVRLGLFTPPQEIVVVAVGEVVELWPAATWRDRVAISDLRTFTEAVLEIGGSEL